MSDLQYVVETLLITNGDKAQTDLDRINGKSKSLGDELFKLGGRLSDGFTGAVEAVGRELMSIGKVGAVAGTAAAAYMLHVNDELEQTQISLAAIFKAQEQVPSMSAGMKMAGDVMTKMREDAAALPGEFSDLAGIMRTIATSGFNAGMNTEALEKFSAQAMAAGAVMGLQSPMVGRELAQALEGRVGAHNVFATRLGFIGDAADKFRKMAPEERVAALTQSLGRYADSVETFKGSFQALWSTALDNLKKFGGQATGPLFDRIKTTLAEINAWFDNNQGTVSVWANEIGRFLVSAFDKGRSIIDEYGPSFLTFASNAYDRFVEIWRDAEPYVKRVADYIKSFLEDKGSIDKIIHLLELYAAVKVGSGAMDMFGGVGKALLGGGQALGALGGGGGAAGAAGAAGLGAAATGILLYDYKAGSELLEKYQADEKMDHDARIKAGLAYLEQLDELGAGTRADVDAARGFEEMMYDLIQAGDLLGASILGAAASAKSAAADFQREQTQNDMQRADDALRYIGLANSGGLVDKIVKQNAEDAKKHGRARGGGGGGGQHINQVLITISSNQAPNQIAKSVMSEIANLRRNPLSSPGVRNFDAATNR